MEFSARQIAELIDGKIEGNQDVTVNKLSTIEEGLPHSISFLSNPAYTSFIYDTNASIVIVDASFVPEKQIKASCTLIRVADARLAFTRLIEAYHQYKPEKTGISKQAFVSNNATIGENVYIASGVYIGEHVVIGKNVKIYPCCSVNDNSRIGDGTVIHNGTQVMEGCLIGAGCVLQPNCVVGSDGFGFAPGSEKNYHKIIHLGNVIIEDNVEIGANTTIDRATLGSTIIRKGVKLDNLIQVAHNVEIGENTVIAAQTGIAGSTKIGKNCMIGGQVGIIGHLTIADEVKIAAQSGIGQSILKKGEIVQGSPAYNIGEYKRSYVLFKKLPNLKQRIEQLEKELSMLKQNIDE